MEVIKKNIRPISIILVFIAEITLFVVFKDWAVDFTKTYNGSEFFKGMGTLIISAPIAFLLWLFRNTDKVKSLDNDHVRLSNEQEKHKLENVKLVQEAERIRAENGKSEAQKTISELENQINELKRKNDELELSYQEKVKDSKKQESELLQLKDHCKSRDIEINSDMLKNLQEWFKTIEFRSVNQNNNIINMLFANKKRHDQYLLKKVLELQTIWGNQNKEEESAFSNKKKGSFGL